jgi:hypothetical protein
VFHRAQKKAVSFRVIQTAICRDIEEESHLQREEERMMRRGKTELRTQSLRSSSRALSLLYSQGQIWGLCIQYKTNNALNAKQPAIFFLKNH